MNRTVSVFEGMTADEVAQMAKDAQGFVHACWMRYAELVGAIPRMSYGSLLRKIAKETPQPKREIRPVPATALGPRIHELEEAAKRVRK